MRSTLKVLFYVKKSSEKPNQPAFNVPYHGGRRD